MAEEKKEEKKEEKQEEHFRREFPKCPGCGCADTTQGLAFKQEVVDKGKVAIGTVSSIAPLVMPLMDPMKAVFGIPMLLEFHATCAGCGLRYCRASQVGVGIPGQAPPGMGQKPPGQKL